jgi:hypothetical protein
MTPQKMVEMFHIRGHHTNATVARWCKVFVDLDPEELYGLSVDAGAITNDTTQPESVRRLAWHLACLAESCRTSGWYANRRQAVLGVAAASRAVHHDDYL